MSFSNMPPAEVEITPGLAVDLLSTQWPGWEDQEVSPLANGWDNVLFRVGPSYVARLPRREMAVQLVINEATWLPALAPRLPLPIPAPVFAGRADQKFPWPWNLVPWLDGRSAAQTSELKAAKVAQQLGSFLADLHQPASPDAPENPYRGGPIIEKDEGVRSRAGQMRGHFSATRIVEVWERVSSADPYAGPPVWLHGDLHPHNLLVVEGALSAVIDFGDVTAGDPATDLAVAWMLVPDHVDVLRTAYGNGDPALWARARAWALQLALAFLANSADNPVMSSVGTRALDAVLSDRPD